MNEEKVLAFLNLRKDDKRDKFMPKLDWGMNIGYTVFIGAFLCFPNFVSLNTAFAISFLVVDLLLGLILIINRNPVYQIILDVLAMLFVASKLFIGFIILSRWQFVEYGTPIYTWVHSIVFLLVACMAIYAISWLWQSYKTIRKYPVRIAQNKIAKMSSPKKWPYIVTVVFGCPVIVAQWFAQRLETFGIGIGFWFWALALIYTMIASAGVLKVAIIFRYKAYTYFKKEKLL